MTDVNPTMEKQGNGSSKSEAHATIHERTSLLVSIVALFFSGIAVGLLIAICLLVPELLDAKIQAGSADARAVAGQARSDAAVAKDAIDRWIMKQELKGK